VHRFNDTSIVSQRNQDSFRLERRFAAERILHRVKFNHVFLPIVINTGAPRLRYSPSSFSLKNCKHRIGHGSSCMRASIGKCSTVSLSIHCNVKSEFANPRSQFRFDMTNVISSRILIPACDTYASATARVCASARDCAAKSVTPRLDFNLP